MSWFAAILLPQFSLQAVLRLRAELWAQPLVIGEGSSEKGSVVEMTASAAARGIWRGMASTQASARCPALQWLPRSPARERAVSDLLLETASTLSPLLEATRGDLCIVDLRSVRAPDWECWAREVVARFATRELRVQVAVAANPDLAALAATRGEPLVVVHRPGEFLTDIRLAEIAADPALISVLHDWGVHSLGELARLSRSELVERLGPAAGALWDRATGRAHRELQLVRPGETFCEVFDFERPIDTTEPLLFILRRQLDQLTLRLREALRVAARLTLTLPLEDGAPYERVFTIPAPTTDVEVLLRILHTHLESLHLEQQPVGVRLLIDPVVGESSQHQLFESPLRDPNRFGETLARLAALVGADNLGVIQLENTHQPDRFCLTAPEFAKPAEAVEAEPAAPKTMGLPLARFRPAWSARVRLGGRPERVSSTKVEGKIIAAAGPYRASGNWWERVSWQVEEWDIELEDGTLFRLSQQGETWFVEGSYQTAET